MVPQTNGSGGQVVERLNLVVTIVFVTIDRVDSVGTTVLFDLLHRHDAMRSFVLRKKTVCSLSILSFIFFFFQYLIDRLKIFEPRNCTQTLRDNSLHDF